jgi:hypothetical protein
MQTQRRLKPALPPCGQQPKERSRKKPQLSNFGLCLLRLKPQRERLRIPRSPMQ